MDKAYMLLLGTIIGFGVGLILSESRRKRFYECDYL